MVAKFQTIQVSLPSSSMDRGYPIVLGCHLLGSQEGWSNLLDDTSGLVVVTDDLVAPLYLDQILSVLKGRTMVTVVTLPAGESSKNMESVEQILDAALKDRHERECVFLALGGGVVGDMTGFAAACFLRGVSFIQVPTTLLAQVDSSVGGKTGINHRMGKNLIGAFHQPAGVIIDTVTLKTLPKREYLSGLAEVIKYGLIKDSVFFDWLLESVQPLLERDETTLLYAIEKSCRIKSEVVASDERERGARAHLNFGHTFGHAIEKFQGYGEWLHGEAVAAGMVMAAKISVLQGGLDKGVLDQLVAFNRQLGLPITPPPNMSLENFRGTMASDKKVSGGKVRYILLEDLGEPIVTSEVSDADIASTLVT